MPPKSAWRLVVKLQLQRVKRNRREQTAAERQTRLSANRQATARARQAETQEQRQARLSDNRQGTACARQEETQEQHQARLSANRQSTARARQEETQEQRQARLERQRQSTHPSRPTQERWTKAALNYNSSYDYSCHPDVLIRAMSQKCQHCQARKWIVSFPDYSRYAEIVWSNSHHRLVFSTPRISWRV